MVTLGTLKGRVASVLGVILLSGCALASPIASHSASPHAAARIPWNDCGGGFQCGTLKVPLDYSNPATRLISLALIRKPAKNKLRRIGSLLLNPGGPGGSGVDFLRGAINLLSNLTARFDLVSWDPRGVNSSAPVTCASGPQLDELVALDPVLDDPQEKQAFIQAIKDFDAACERRSGDLLPFMDSASTARDMDKIREAVGDSKLTYLGFSYGTYIGQWYAHLFPTHVRALSLDGVVDPALSGSDALFGQVAGFEENLQAFLSDCRSRSSCAYARSGDPEVKLKAAMARVDATPLKVGNRQLTRGLALRGVLVTLYDQSSWRYLDQALTGLDTGDGRLLLALADFAVGRNPDGTYSNLINGGNNATGCIDGSRPPTDIAFYDALGPALSKASPLFGPSAQYSALLCAYWPVTPKNPPPLTVHNVPPILLVGGTNDPATRYAWAQSVNRQIPGSVLLTREGNGHTSYGSSSCARAAEEAYLINLTLPPKGTVCSG